VLTCSNVTRATSTVASTSHTTRPNSATFRYRAGSATIRPSRAAPRRPCRASCSTEVRDTRASAVSAAANSAATTMSTAASTNQATS
jgi:hypothetical protein